MMAPAKAVLRGLTGLRFASVYLQCRWEVTVTIGWSFENKHLFPVPKVLSEIIEDGLIIADLGAYCCFIAQFV